MTSLTSPGSWSPGLVQHCQAENQTESPFVPAALQLASALDLPDGSCAFEEDTCGFDSVFAFLPWILNEEGKRTL